MKKRDSIELIVGIVMLVLIAIFTGSSYCIWGSLIGYMVGVVVNEVKK